MSQEPTEVQKECLRICGEKNDGWHRVGCPVIALAKNSAVAASMTPIPPIPGDLRDVYELSKDYAAKMLPGWSCSEQVCKLIERIARLEAENRQEDQAHEQTISQRDAAEEALSNAYLSVTGHEAIWSNLFGYNEALDDICSETHRLKQHIAKLTAEVERLQTTLNEDQYIAEANLDLHARLTALEAENTRLKAEVSDEEWKDWVSLAQSGSCRGAIDELNTRRATRTPQADKEEK